MTIEELTTLEGRITYLKTLKENLDKDNTTPLAFGLVISGALTDLQLLDFYKHKFGKIDLKEFAEYSQKWNEERIAYDKT